jgi:hypothetical protein
MCVVPCTICEELVDMSLLGPDDFDLSSKKRRKKLAKDLSPGAQKMIEKWIDEMDERMAIEKISELVGPEEAQRILMRRKSRKKRDDD